MNNRQNYVLVLFLSMTCCDLGTQPAVPAKHTWQPSTHGEPPNETLRLPLGMMRVVPAKVEGQPGHHVGNSIRSFRIVYEGSMKFFEYWVEIWKKGKLVLNRREARHVFHPPVNGHLKCSFRDAVEEGTGNSQLEIVVELSLGNETDTVAWFEPSEKLPHVRTVVLLPSQNSDYAEGTEIPLLARSKNHALLEEVPPKSTDELVKTVDWALVLKLRSARN